MARQPTVPILAGQGSGIVPPQAQIKPDTKLILDLSGGLNTSRPPDQVEDRDSPDLMNLVYMNKVLCVDFGFRPIGSPVLGIPMQPIEWISPLALDRWSLLVTSQTVYSFNQVSQDWVPLPSSRERMAVRQAALDDDRRPLVILDQRPGPGVHAIALSDGGWIAGRFEETEGGYRFSAAVPEGRAIERGAEVYAAPTFTSDGTVQISWATDPSHAWLLFTNGFDLPQRFDGATCQPIPGISAVLQAARHISRFHGVTVVAYTTEAGTPYIYRVRRSATNDPTNWTSLDAGFDDLVDTGDPITDVLSVNPYLVFMRTESIVRATYYGIGTQVFWYDYGLTTTGSIDNQASVNTKTSSIFVSEAGIFQYDGNYGLTDVGEKVYTTLLTYTGELNQAANLPTFLLYVPMLDETWIFYADFTEDWPNKVLRLNHATGAWFKRRWANPCCFAGAGLFSQPTAVRWIDLGNTRWIDRHRPWHARALQPLFHQIMLCGAEDHQTYLYDWNTTTSDNGLPIRWYYVSKDYPLPDEWRTLDGIIFYGKGIITLVEISTNYGVTWQQLAQNVVLGPTWARGDADCSLTCEFVRIRFSGNDPSFKLSWFAFRTMSASER